MKRKEMNDAEAIHRIGHMYYTGMLGLPQDNHRATELFQKAAELGSIDAHHALSIAYNIGLGVERDILKGIHHLQLAAVGGHEGARYNLGQVNKCISDEDINGMDRAMKHWMIAAKSGCNDSLKEVGKGYRAGYITKDEYASTLRAHQTSQDEMKSEQRKVAESYDDIPFL